MTEDSSRAADGSGVTDVALAGARSVLIVRLSALGDVVHALPLLDALRRARPKAELAWIVEDGAAPLLRDHPQLDRLWIFPRRAIVAYARRGRLIKALGLLLRFVRELRGARYEISVDAQCNLRSSGLAWLSGAPRRVGFAPPYTKEKSHWLSTHRVRPSTDRQLKVERNLELLRPLGIDTRGARAQLAVPASARAWARTFFTGLGGGAVVGIHPGVSQFGAIKGWAPERFAAAARRLAEERGIRSVVTWGPGERFLAEAVVRDAGDAAVLAPETSSILELAALYECCAAVIGSDTGPVHLAAALGVPVVGLYGPKDPAVYAPWSGRTGGAATTVWKQVHCSPCRLRRCNNVICMPAIQVDDVLAALRRSLSADESAHASAPSSAGGV